MKNWLYKATSILFVLYGILGVISIFFRDSIFSLFQIMLSPIPFIFLLGFFGSDLPFTIAMFLTSLLFLAVGWFYVKYTTTTKKQNKFISLSAIINFIGGVLSIVALFLFYSLCSQSPDCMQGGFLIFIFNWLLWLLGFILFFIGLMQEKPKSGKK